MDKLIDRVKELKNHYLIDGITDEEVIERISDDLDVNTTLIRILYNLV